MKILIIGAGSIGSRYARLLSDKEDVAVLDLNASHATRVAEELGVMMFQDVSMAVEWGMDAAIIATPAGSHAELVKCLVDSARLLLIEKPIAATEDDLEAIQQVIASSNTTARVVSNMRFHPGPAALKDHLAQVGEIYCCRAHFGQWLPAMRPHRDYREMYCAHAEDGGGVILDCIHEIDYLAWLFGAVQSVSGRVGKLSSLEIDGPDWSSFVMEHDSGVVSEVHLDYLQATQRRGCEIIGSNGTLIWSNQGTDPAKCTVRFHGKDESKYIDLFDGVEIVDDLYQAMLDHFVTGDSQNHLASISEGIDAVKIAVDISGTDWIERKGTSRV